MSDSKWTTLHYHYNDGAQCDTKEYNDKDDQTIFFFTSKFFCTVCVIFLTFIVYTIAIFAQVKSLLPGFRNEQVKLTSKMNNNCLFLWPWIVQYKSFCIYSSSWAKRAWEPKYMFLYIAKQQIGTMHHFLFRSGQCIINWTHTCYKGCCFFLPYRKSAVLLYSEYLISNKPPAWKSFNF